VISFGGLFYLDGTDGKGRKVGIVTVSNSLKCSSAHYQPSLLDSGATRLIPLA
jgi:hypothetical protein